MSEWGGIAGLAGEVDSPDCVFGAESPTHQGKPSPLNPHRLTRELISIRYLDHVLFHRTPALAMKPQVRETVGWLVYECDQYIILAWDCDADPPTIRGGDPKASGLVVLKTDILELKRLQICPQPLQEKSCCHLNSQTAIGRDEYALPAKKRKTLRKGEKAK